LGEYYKQPNSKTLKDEYVLTSSRKFKLKELAEIFTKTTGRKLNINWGKREYRKREVMIPWERGTILPQWKVNTTIDEGIKKLL